METWIALRAADWDGSEKRPIQVDLVFVFPMAGKPKPGWARQWCQKHADRDNLDKAILDAITDAFPDDRHVVTGTIDKKTAGDGDIPGVAIRIQEAPESTASWADHLIQEAAEQFQQALPF